MASGGSKLKMSEETFDYICTSCAEEDLIKESIKYCEVCQRHCCSDCVTSHKRIPMLKGHSLVDNSSGPSPGQQTSLPSFPTEICRIHKGKLLDMYCGQHKVVCCYVCVSFDHKRCNDLHSITDDIDTLYRQSDTDKTKSNLAGMLKTLEERRDTTNELIRQLRGSKNSSIQAVKDHRAIIDQRLDTLEAESIKELERDFQKMESELLEEKQRYDNLIKELKMLDDLIAKSEGNMAQTFVCTTLGQLKLATTEKAEKDIDAERKSSVLMTFVPCDRLKQLVDKLTSLGRPSVIVYVSNRFYRAKTIGNIVIKPEGDDNLPPYDEIDQLIMTVKPVGHLPMPVIRGWPVPPPPPPRDPPRRHLHRLRSNSFDSDEELIYE